MEYISYLSDDFLIDIAARVAGHSMYDLFYFQRQNKRIAALCRDHVVSGAFGNDCIELLTDLEPTYEKLDFMNRLWDHGNHMFCILRCTHQLLPAKSRIGTIKRLLRNAMDTGSVSAMYFDVLIGALGGVTPDIAELFKDFWDLLMTRNVSRYRRDIMGGDTPFRFISGWYNGGCPLIWFVDAFATTGITALGMEEGVTFGVFFLLMMKSTSFITSASIVASIVKLDG